MRSFKGSGGKIFLVSDPVSFFGLPLEDCGDGFDWRAADETMRHWAVDVPVALQIALGEEWVSVTPEWIFHASGRIGFSRSLRGTQVKASGTCFPTTLICEGKSWEMNVGMITVDRSELGTQDQRFESVPAQSTVTFEVTDGSSLPSMSDKVVVFLPHGAGAFFSRGEVATVSQKTIKILLDEQGVTYGPF